jgi:DNA-directed RNA polymerase subunit RPC12/RpoP
MTDTAAAPLTQREFPCSRCGAKLEFQPGTDSLVCPHCGTTNAIAASPDSVPLLDFLLYTGQTAGTPETCDQLVVHCTSCGAETHLAADITAGRCAFCGAPVVAEGQSKKLIKPAGLLPFIVTKVQANALFRKWISGLWFAPSDLSKRADQAGIDGAYVPCWTYNANAQTAYTGERGDDYTTTESHTEMVNGHAESRTETVTHTRWTSVSGDVFDTFENLMVLATQSLPPKQANHLEPWDLAHVIPYADEYLSGMSCQSYQIDLTHGFDQAKNLMTPTIRQSIDSDIGGDHQRISSTNTNYSDIRFRHLLLPLWISAYHYNSKTYRFLVNARTGAVRGERPFSAMKIVAFITTVIAAIAILAVVMNHVHH